MPEEHKKFLAHLVWVHEEVSTPNFLLQFRVFNATPQRSLNISLSIHMQENVCIETSDGIKNCRLIAVHAGLQKGKKVEEQLGALKAKDTRIPKVEALSGRMSVWDIPEVNYWKYLCPLWY